MVSQALEDSKLCGVKKYMASSTSKSCAHKCYNNMPTHSFTDLPLLHVTQKTSFCALETQQINIPSNSQTKSTLSAPPFWKLQTDALVERQVTVGYGAFVTQYE
jgi:hypothetical protein